MAKKLEQTEVEALTAKVVDAVDTAIGYVQEQKLGRARQALCRALTAIENAVS